ncbi:hypothetical protein CV102_14460 [Natronococcus pandeyae]|uniref:Uncharacterized protein n=1 Tax=Natronococcus pandeyae TaxID=2055836 RepID=A0A8J8Q5J3_9EURY|nr:hypothetical protein CV102_14460 [Natronococcus pandeyae]
MAAATAVGVGTVAGCLDETDEAEEENRGGDDGNENGDDEEMRALAAEMVEAIDDDLSVTDWELNGMFVPEYVDSRGVEDDVPILGDAYAEIVDQGFDRRAMPTALDDDGDVEFMVFLETEWANAFLDGDWSEEEYYAEIEDSEH